MGVVTACGNVSSSQATVEVINQVAPSNPTTNRLTLDTVIMADPPTLDPAIATDSDSIFFIRQMFVGLTTFDANANVIPALATRWEASNNGLIWTFHLRDDIHWIHRNISTGKFEKLGPVTAHDVVYGVRRSLDPNTDSSYAYVLYILEGAEELNRASKGDSAQLELLLAGLGVKALDAHTVQFTLRQPAAYFPSIAATWVTFPQPQAVIKTWGHTWTEAGLIVTNGPYTLRQWNRGLEIWLEKNPFWVNAAEVQIELFGGPIIAPAPTALAMYKNNEIDMLASPPGPLLSPLELAQIRADAHLNADLHTAPSPCTYYYGFVNTKPPFDNPLVRKAFAAAIDRRGLTEEVLKSGQRPAHSFAPPGVFGSVAGNTSVGGFLVQANYADQLAQAQTWLAQAGYPGGDGLDITLGHNASEAHAQIAQAVWMMWQAAFPKAKITIESQEWADYLAALKPDSPDEDKPDIFRMGWCADYPDQNNWVNDVFNSKSGSNYAKYYNPQFDALVEQAAFEPNPAIREALYYQAEDILITQDTAIIPLYYYTDNRLYKPWLSNVATGPVFGNPIARWRIDWAAKQAARGE
jgi:oligopeptide transport system substrate-binding protein